MFRFANPEYLYLLLLIPILIALFIYSRKKRKEKLNKIGDRDLVFQLVPDYSNRRKNIKFWIIMVVIGLLVVMLARPQFGTKIENVRRQGVEIIFALDVSNSMMAEDVEPNRLEKAKRMITQLIDKMSDDKVGLIVFAGEAYTQIPITSDYVSAKMFMPSITPALVPSQGTAIGSSIDLAMRSFGIYNDEEEKNVGRAIVVITDGENHEDDAVGAAKEATNNGIIVNVIGIGNPEGSPIPQKGVMSFKKDENGETIITKLNEKMCMDIAKTGNGIYVRADNTNKAEKIIEKAIDTMAKSDIETKVYSAYDEKFQVFGMLALMILLLDLMISERHNKWLDNFHILDRIKGKKITSTNN